MSSNPKDFYGKEVPDAIRRACETLKLAQEKLAIEVLETGSTGIFGLIRKKAHIRVTPKPEVDEAIDGSFDVETILGGDKVPRPKEEQSQAPQVVEQKKPEPPRLRPKKIAQEKKRVVQEKKRVKEETKEKEVKAETVDFVRTEILRIVELMGCPSTVDIGINGISVICTLHGESEEYLIGPEGKTLDSIQYLLRKIVARKVSEQLRLTVNVGDYREKRLEELKVKAVELAALVKEDGKTQVLPALNPSERRTIHMILQEDKDIRSRSVGDGLFKKILIFKPGKGGRSGGRKRSHSRGRQGKSSKNSSRQKRES